MNWYNERYSAYFAAPDKAYPLGSAVDSTSEDNLDGTPYLAAFFNDVIGSMQAIIFGVFGTNYEVSGKPDSCVKSDVWDAIKKFVNDGDKTLQDAVDAINAKIPSQASATNQLADKDFVNSSIATNTAYFIGTFDSVAQLNAYSGTKTNNDYAFVKSTDSAGNTIFSRYKWNGTAWLYEYELNNSSFTASQWAAVNSGATAAKIALIKTMTGASAGAAGTSGFVPQPAAGKQNSYLCGDGTWKEFDLSGYITRQSAFDAAHPVGSTYVQFPQQDSPETVFNNNGVISTWQVIDYGGAFFRAQGGNANGFIDKWEGLTEQSESLPNISGVLSGQSTAAGMGGGSVNFTRSGALNYKSANKQRTGGGVYGNVLIEISIDASDSNPVYGRRDEVAPQNYTIRVWKRIS